MTLCRPLPREKQSPLVLLPGFCVPTVVSCQDSLPSLSLSPRPPQESPDHILPVEPEKLEMPGRVSGALPRLLQHLLPVLRKPPTTSCDLSIPSGLLRPPHTTDCMWPLTPAHIHTHRSVPTYTHISTTHSPICTPHTFTHVKPIYVSHMCMYI